MSASAKTAGAVGVSLSAIVVLVATQGEGLFATMTAGFNWLMLVVEKMPIGVASFFVAIVMGVSVMGALRRWIPESKRNDLMHLRLAFIEAAAALAAFFTVWVQQKSLMSTMFAVIAGLSISIVFRLCAAMWDVICERIRTK